MRRHQEESKEQMPQENYALVERNLVQATGIVLPALSGAMAGIAADADVYVSVNLHASRCFSLRWYPPSISTTRAAGPSLPTSSCPASA